MERKKAGGRTNGSRQSRIRLDANSPPVPHERCGDAHCVTTTRHHVSFSLSLTRGVYVRLLLPFIFFSLYDGNSPINSFTLTYSAPLSVRGRREGKGSRQVPALFGAACTLRCVCLCFQRVSLSRRGATASRWQPAVTIPLPPNDPIVGIRYTLRFSLSLSSPCPPIPFPFFFSFQAPTRSLAFLSLLCFTRG